MALLVDKSYLDDLCCRYETADFIENDPISVPHRFSKREDIEISAFLASTIAWGNRKIIVRNAHKMVDMMDGEPYKFVMTASDIEMRQIDTFVHRTFNGVDFQYFIDSLRSLYKSEDGLGCFFERRYQFSGDLRVALKDFYDVFFSFGAQDRTRRHLSSIAKGSACKRLNMFLRWMVRDGSVDFGLWGNIPKSALYLPLDVHSSTVARKLGLLERSNNDWRAVEEVTKSLRELDPNDPIKYDFALFSAGIEKAL